MKHKNVIEVMVIQIQYLIAHDDDYNVITSSADAYSPNACKHLDFQFIISDCKASILLDKPPTTPAPLVAIDYLSVHLYDQ